MHLSQKISNKEKNIIFLFVILFLLLGAAVFAQRELETQYPAVPGAVTPTTVEGTQLPDYVKYIFNFAIIIAGVVAFGVIVWGGVRWLTSAGDPTKLKDAKEQIFAAFLGLVILFTSYLILTTINPELVVFEEVPLETVKETPSPSPTQDLSPDPLVRIKELAQTIEGVSLDLKKESEELKAELEQCQCQNSNSECYCSDLSCVAKRCFGDPCKNMEEIKLSLSGGEIIIAPGELREEIKIRQRKVIAKTDEVLYYRNRISSEKEDITPELKQFIRLDRLTEAGGNDLIKNLEEVALLLEKIAISSKAFGEIPNSCLPDSCAARCQQETCHHTCWTCGNCNDICRPIECTGAPCPPFNDKVQEIENIQLEISKICQNIINILK